ncbi:MAG: bifunctional riboflavin kinase/FAD synthetase [Pseudomonadota bacterium]
MWFGRHSVPAGIDLASVGSVVTIGAYDGLHIGHEVVLDKVRSEARRYGARSVVMSFEPTPKEFFAGEYGSQRLMSFRQRFIRLRDLDVDLFFCPRFDTQLANESARSFVRHWLVDVLHCRHIVVGDDFRYGRQRAGTFDTLTSAGRDFGFTVERTESVCKDGERVSSTAIRAALQAGDLGLAERLLGRSFAIEGRVRHGKKLGRTLGYPTANLAVRRRLCPPHGIYAVTVNGAGLTNHAGVASLGTRPTVDDHGQVLLEVHLFDIERDLYGERLEVSLRGFLRAEEKFASLDLLVAQMNEDEKTAREILAAAGVCAQ